MTGEHLITLAEIQNAERTNLFQTDDQAFHTPQGTKTVDNTESLKVSRHNLSIRTLCTEDPTTTGLLTLEFSSMN